LLNALLAPPLKWAGGKRWLIPRLSSLWKQHSQKRLVEPFVGGMAVALGLSPSGALLSDANPHLISFYRALQRGVDIMKFRNRFQNVAEVYYANRLRFNELVAAGEEESEEAAALFYYLNRTGYNGLCRFNNSGGFNVPFGLYKTVSYDRNLDAYAQVLRNYEFLAGDFEDIVLDRSDFVYADPPYDVEFTSYSAGGFSYSDQERLAQWLSAHPGPVIASNQATPRILNLYRRLGFDVETVSAPRRISCDGNRDDAREMLATKNL
jgi:DNA adenine methylase